MGFDEVFDPGTPVSEEKGEIIEVSMHDFSPEAAIWLAFCGAEPMITHFILSIVFSSAIIFMIYIII